MVVLLSAVIVLLGQARGILFVKKARAGKV